MKNIELKFNIDYKKASKSLAGFFIHHSSIVLILIGLIFLGYCAYVWYEYVYSYAWDEVKKQEYMNNKNAGTSLNRVKFEKALKEIDRRKEEYGKPVENTKDFFKLQN